MGKGDIKTFRGKIFKGSYGKNRSRKKLKHRRMVKKVGRNSTCPCGSGKKYKNCCINKPDISFHKELKRVYNQKETNFIRYIKGHDSRMLLNLIIGAQLLPENHGKEVRLEILSREIVKNLRTGEKAKVKEFVNIIDKEYGSHYLEDPLEGLFAENLIFHGGNYTVLPGIAVDSGNLFTYFSRAIFNMKNAIPEKVKKYIYGGTTLMFELGNRLFNPLGIVGNVQGNPNDSIIIFKKEAEPFTDQFVRDLMGKKRIDPNVLKEFLTDINDPGLGSEDPDENPLLYQPLIQFDNKYYFATPIVQLQSVNNFIKKTIINNKLEGELIDNFNMLIWEDVLQGCNYMNWLGISIPLPPLADGIHIKEIVCQFDIKHLVYVQYVYLPFLIARNVNDNMNLEYGFGLEYTQIINSRAKEVIDSLKGNDKLEDFRFLTLILYNNMGQDGIIGIEGPELNEERIYFSVYDFLDLGRGKEWSQQSLWKFAKAYRKLTEKIEVNPSSIIDAYGIFKHYKCSFYMSDDKKPNSIYFIPGSGSKLLVESKVKRNYHGVLKRIDGQIGYLPVEIYKDYAPVYKSVRPFESYALFIESFSFPFWIINKQCISDSNESIIDSHMYAIAFWLSKIAKELCDKIESILNQYIELEIEFDESYFKSLTYDEILKFSETTEIQANFTFDSLKVFIPIGVYTLLYKEDNSGERYILQEILLALNKVPNITITIKLIEELIDKYIPLGPAKMILSMSTDTDIRLDPRWLYPILLISDAEINMFLDELPSLLNYQTEIPRELKTADEKNIFCNHVVLTLIRHLLRKIEVFNSNDLLRILIQLNERLIYKRELNKIRVPAQIHCFGDFEGKIKEFEKEEIELITTALSLRCLIELLSIKPFFGAKKPSYNEIEDLLVIMSEIINYGTLSDSIYFGLDDPKIGLLHSGRIGVSKEFIDTTLKTFKSETTYANIEYAVRNISNKLKPRDFLKTDGTRDDYINKINEAFLKDWGITLSNIYSLGIGVINLSGDKENSLVEMLEEDLIKILLENTKIPVDQIKSGLYKLSLSESDGILTNEIGYENKEYYPWRYNRKQSLSRRPFIKIEANGKTTYRWGMRQVYDSIEYLFTLLFEGRLKDEGSEIEKMVGQIEEVNGKDFRNLVKDWLKNNTKFQIWDYEIKISPKGHLVSVKDYGDIDILVYDNHRKVYSIECKNTVQPRIIHEMKTELDNYLGKKPGSGKVIKHVARDIWLNANKKILADFIKTDNDDLEIKSLIITSEVIPLPFIKKNIMPLTFLSFPELRRDGEIKLDT